jgi:polysaccharide pyruvyl transferase
MRKVYSWGGKPNFGDRLTGFILDQLGVQHRWASPAEADLVAVGSVLDHLPHGWDGAVVGAGVMYPDTVPDLSNARVRALRGKLTRGLVVGIDKSSRIALGDPGLLVSLFVPRCPAKYDLGIVPHWSDTELAQRFPYAHVIDVTQPPERVATEIASCQRIISSSLHGLVVADAYGISRQAELFARADREGGDFKFRDYQSVYHSDNSRFGEVWRAPHEEVEGIQETLLAALGDELGESVLCCATVRLSRSTASRSRS